MIFSTTFVSSFASIDSLPKDGRAEIALIGRSNVGKSSLINALAARKELAKTSGTPGKTRTLNFYLVNGGFYLVDMPGYGYAKQAKTERGAWARLTERYFLERNTLAAVGLLFDARHAGLASDLTVLEWLRENRIPVFAVLTKSDKAREAECAKHVRKLRDDFGVLMVFRTSSEKGTGIAELRKFIADTARNAASANDA